MEQVKTLLKDAILKAIKNGYTVNSDSGWGLEYHQAEEGAVMKAEEYGTKKCCAGGAFLLFGPEEMIQPSRDPQKGTVWVFGNAFGLTRDEVGAFTGGFDSVFVPDPEEGPSDLNSLIWRNLGSLMGQFAGRHNRG
jgi:hypothetical protein